MSRRGARAAYGDDDWGYSSNQKGTNGDILSPTDAASMTREFDDLMRIIEADWNFVTTTNVWPIL